MVGSKAQASAANDTPTHVAFIDENGKVTDKPLYFFLERYMQSFTDEMTEFIDCVLHDKPTKTTVEDGFRRCVWVWLPKSRWPSTAR